MHLQIVVYLTTVSQTTNLSVFWGMDNKTFILSLMCMYLLKCTLNPEMTAHMNCKKTTVIIRCLCVSEPL